MMRHVLLEVTSDMILQILVKVDEALLRDCNLGLACPVPNIHCRTLRYIFCHEAYGGKTSSY